VAENIITLDDETLAAIDAAAAILGHEYAGPREPDEFTATEYGDRMGLSSGRANGVLHKAVMAGKLTRRRSGSGYLYKVVIK